MAAVATNGRTPIALVANPSLRMEEVCVTPAVAFEWLKAMEPSSNRHLSDATVLEYTEVMRVGGWTLSPHGIVFDKKGRLRDGQHRLAAIVQSKKTIPMMVIYGATDEMIKNIDMGRNRRVAEVLMMSGADGKKARTAAAIAAGLVYLERGRSGRMTRASFEMVIDKFGDEVAKMSELAMSRLSGPLLTALAYAYPIDPDKVMELAMTVQDRKEVLQGTVAAAVLRQLADPRMRRRVTKTEQLHKWLRAVQLHVEDSPTERLLPTSLGYEWAKAKRLEMKLPLTVMRVLTN